MKVRAIKKDENNFSEWLFGHSYADCAPTIHLPSLSKPVNRAGQSLFGASQGAIMEVYDNGVSIQCLAFKNQGDTGYRNQVIGTIDI